MKSKIRRLTEDKVPIPRERHDFVVSRPHIHIEIVRIALTVCVAHAKQRHQGEGLRPIVDIDDLCDGLFEGVWEITKSAEESLPVLRASLDDESVFIEFGATIARNVTHLSMFPQSIAWVRSG